MGLKGILPKVKSVNGQTGNVVVSGGSGNANTYNEVPTGLINSSNKVYTTTGDFVAGSTRIHLNGMKQILGSDYTETDVDEITMTLAPFSGDSLTIDYEEA